MVFCRWLLFHPSRLAPGTSTAQRKSPVARWRRIVSWWLDYSDLVDSYSVRRPALVRHSGIVRLRPHMASDRTRSTKLGDQLRLAATIIYGDSGCASPN